MALSLCDVNVHNILSLKQFASVKGEDGMQKKKRMQSKRIQIKSILNFKITSNVNCYFQ